MLLKVCAIRISPAEPALNLIVRVDSSLEFPVIFNKARNVIVINYFYEILDYLVFRVLTFDKSPIVDLIA